MSTADPLTAATPFPRAPVALFALVASPLGGWFAIFLGLLLLDLTSGYASADMDDLRGLLLRSGILAALQACLILIIGLPLVLIGLYVAAVRRRTRLKLWRCLLGGALCGLLFSMLIGVAYYDPDDFIGEPDPGRLGYWLQDWWFAAAMAVPGIASGATFWLVSRLFARGEVEE